MVKASFIIRQMGDEEGFGAVEGETDRVFVYLFNSIDSIRAGPPLTSVIRRPPTVRCALAIREACWLREPHAPINSTSTQQFQPPSMHESRRGWRREGGVGEDQGQDGGGWAR